MAKVKICGVTNLEDALAAIFLGADALGFVFYKNSPRYIAPERARNIIKIIPPNIMKIGVFVSAKEGTIKRIARSCRLKALQFHGNESLDFCRKFNGYKVIKAFRIGNKIGLKDIKRYRVYAYLFDTYVKSKVGGTGKRFNWRLIKDIREKIKQPIFLSGGLDIKNVKKAIRLIRPDWVDVSSGVEIKPGEKDKNKVRKFIELAKGGR